MVASGPSRSMVPGSGVRGCAAAQPPTITAWPAGRSRPSRSASSPGSAAQPRSGWQCRVSSSGRTRRPDARRLRAALGTRGGAAVCRRCTRKGHLVTSSGWRSMPPSAGRCPRPPAGVAGPPPAGRRCARWRARTRGTRSPPPRRFASRRGARMPSCCTPRSGTTWSGPTRPPTAPPAPYSPSATRATVSRCCSPRCSHSRRVLGGEAAARGRPSVRPRSRNLPAPA